MYMYTLFPFYMFGFGFSSALPSRICVFWEYISPWEYIGLTQRSSCSPKEHYSHGGLLWQVRQQIAACAILCAIATYWHYYCRCVLLPLLLVAAVMLTVAVAYSGCYLMQLFLIFVATCGHC